MLRRLRYCSELTATDPALHTRYALLGRFGQLGTNAAPFLPEIRALIAASVTAEPVYQEIAAKAAWRILNAAEPAKEVMPRLAAAASKREATAADVNRFAASALHLDEVPGVRELAAALLGELSHYPETSAAELCVQHSESRRRKNHPCAERTALTQPQ
jgi:hypothetical protein